jgi:hypothetical protein
MPVAPPVVRAPLSHRLSQAPGPGPLPMTITEHEHPERD